MPLIESLKGLDEMRTVKIELTKEEIDLLNSLVARHFHQLQHEYQYCDEEFEESLKEELELTGELWEKIDIALDKIHRVWEVNSPKHWTL